MNAFNNLSNRYFYHFSYIDNLTSIVEHGLLPTNKKNKLGIEHRDVASESIQQRRSEMAVTCAPKGNIHDYVPFYMCVRNPMFLSLVNSKNIDQQGLIFFAFKMDKIDGVNVVFTDASANTAVPPNFYNDRKDLDKLDWGQINSQKWGGGTKAEMHRRMAEVLIKGTVPIVTVDHIVVWNEGIKKEVLRIFKEKGIEPPNVCYSPIGTNPQYHFFYTKFMLGLDNESLITGPQTLLKRYKNIVKLVRQERKKIDSVKAFLFEDIADCLIKLADDFTLIVELEGIHNLETDNVVHAETVSDHTLLVINALKDQIYYQNLDQIDQNILQLSAYLHDIGKGPKSRWKNGIQKAYPDHPADAPEMLLRILTEDFKNLSNHEIRKICLLVTYHDLIGEIFGHGRNKQQLFDIIEDESDFDMLSALNLADVTVLNFMWTMGYNSKIKALRTEVIKNFEEK